MELQNRLLGANRIPDPNITYSPGEKLWDTLPLMHTYEIFDPCPLPFCNMWITVQRVLPVLTAFYVGRGRGEGVGIGRKSGFFISMFSIEKRMMVQACHFATVSHIRLARIVEHDTN